MSPDRHKVRHCFGRFGGPDGISPSSFEYFNK